MTKLHFVCLSIILQHSAAPYPPWFLKEMFCKLFDDQGLIATCYVRALETLNTFFQVSSNNID